MRSSISIVGCGWLGLPLGQTLHNHGYNVAGSTTTPSKQTLLRQHNIMPYIIECTTNAQLTTSSPSFFTADHLIITLPFKRSLPQAAIYFNQIKSIVSTYLTHNPNLKHVLLTSSTSIYSPTNTTVTENTPITAQTERQQALYNTEQYILNLPLKSTIIRCGGLFGYGRHIGQFYSKTKTKNLNCPVNLIHCDDVIGIILATLTHNHTQEIFNAVCPDHPQKSTLYAFHTNNPIPNQPLTQQPNSYKIVSSKKAQNLLAYSFKYAKLMTTYD